MVGEGDCRTLVGVLISASLISQIGRILDTLEVLYGGYHNALLDPASLKSVQITRSSRIASISSLRHGTPSNSAPDPSLLLITI